MLDDVLVVLDGRPLSERLVGWVRPPTGFDHILVPVDLDERAAAIVSTGVSLARRHGARLTLMHALHPAPRRSLLTEGVSWELGDGARQQHRDQCLARLAALAPAEPGLEVGRLVVTGDAPTAVVMTATRLGVDLIVIGRPRARRFIGPSLAEVLVERGPCPVLVVRSTTPGAAEWRPAHAGA